MNESNNDACAICNKQPEDMLLLQCNHNLCLDCATQLFIASQNQSLQCEICFITTNLDNETISCLTSLAKQLCTPAVKEPEPFIPRPPQRELIRDDVCYDHREKALYYCFDCQIGTICSECILGSSHSGHKVFTLKKATKILEQQLVENSKHLEGLKGAIQQKVQTVRLKSNDLSKEYQQKQKKLKNIFDDIARQVHQRYTQLSIELERYSQRGIQIFEGCLNQLEQKLRLIDTTIKQNRMIIQQNNSQLIIRRIGHLQLQKDYNPQIPSNLPQNHLFLSFQDSICLQLQQLMKKLRWQDSSQPQFQKQNRRQLYNINEDGSLLYEDKQRQIFPEFIGYQRKQKQLNQSVNKYSGIKSSSRRLQLSRSMDNATNIINKLQERIRR